MPCEAHFNSESKEATTSRTILLDIKMLTFMVDDNMNIENTIIKYNSNDLFGDLN
jgi:hypothetical protein